MKIRLLLTFSIFLFCITKSQATIYYVNGAAAVNGNGLSWSNAFNDLQMAMSVVVYGDEIWVASGQYKATNTSDRSASFVLKNGVNLFGGFSGVETAINQRDIANNPTTLNGDIGILGETSDNTRNILRANNITSTITVDGFRIMNGNSNNSNQEGGGLLYTNSENGLLILRNCYFFSNSAYNYGGGISMEKSKLTIEHCEFRNNKCSSSGGAIYNYGGSTLIITDTKFIGNTAFSGACLDHAAEFKKVVVDRCIFTNNVSENSIFVLDEFTDSSKVTNSYFIGNSVNDFTSSIFTVGEMISSGSFELTNCTFVDNFNTYENGISDQLIKIEKSSYSVRNCIFYGNTSVDGLQLNLGANLSNCLVEGGYSGGTNILDTIPYFVNRNNGAQTNFDATNFDYTLASNSPCINYGDNYWATSAFDLDSNQRIQGCLVDLGCYETNASYVFHTIDTVVACDSFTWIDGNIYTTNNNSAVFSTQSVLGCDSIVTLNLTINHSSTGIDSITACDSYTWIDGITYTSSNNTATYVLPTTNGCDSIVTLHLTIQPNHHATSAIQEVVACDSYEWIDDSIYTQSTSFPTVILPNSVGCDSIVTLHLTINASTNVVDQILSCEPYTWIDGNTYTQSNNTATYVVQKANGCDSVVHLHLSITDHQLNTDVQVNNQSLISKANSNVTYQWINCADNSIIPGATSKIFSPSESGNYAVIITSTICSEKSDTSACYLVDLVGLTKIENPSVTLFPNPTTSDVTVRSATSINQAKVIDLKGKILKTLPINAMEFKLNMMTFSKGIYLLQLEEENGRIKTYKLSKE